MPGTIDDACDMLRGRVRRVAGPLGKNLTKLAPAIGISHVTLKKFMQGAIADEHGSLEIATLRKIEEWCLRKEQDGY